MLHPRHDFILARWVFARCLGAIFFCAFGSLGLQIRGLAGERGIVPAASWLDGLRAPLGSAFWWKVPTLCWMGASDPALVALCIVGLVFSLVLMWGERLPGPCALGLWLLYLSLFWVTNPFLGFQWDTLLLETALLAAVWLPWRWKPDWRRTSFPTEAARWLIWWLLFRLMFQSGVVKLASHDPSWRELTSLDYHFESQPLPFWSSWLVHQAPELLLCLATFVMFVIELAVPFFIFAPRRWRHGAAWCLIGLQAAIAATGNYAFFNLLTMALCVPLFEDATWPARLRNRFKPPEAETAASPAKWKLILTLAAATVVFLITAPPLASSLGLADKWIRPLVAMREWVSPLASFNGYGLFQVMTTERREIIVEGSKDGHNWRAYEFPWKPGDIQRRPGLVAPYQPRLDWQMWFAALGTVQHNPWFVQFLVRLLEGSPEVLGLLANDPFPGEPPVYVRAVLYRYEFTRFGDGNAGWWKRTELGLYCPPIMLRSGKPVVAGE